MNKEESLKKGLTLSAVEKRDRSEILALAKQFHDETVFRGLEFSEKKFEAAFVENPAHLGSRSQSPHRLLGSVLVRSGITSYPTMPAS